MSTPYAGFRVELAKVGEGLDDTLGDLLAALTTQGEPVAAARVDEAQAFLTAALRSLALTLTTLEKAHP